MATAAVQYRSNQIMTYYSVCSRVPTVDLRSTVEQFVYSGRHSSCLRRYRYLCYALPASATSTAPLHPKQRKQALSSHKNTKSPGKAAYTCTLYKPVKTILNWYFSATVQINPLKFSEGVRFETNAYLLIR